jgi:ketosteroid isomerase-like protein
LTLAVQHRTSQVRSDTSIAISRSRASDDIAFAHGLGRLTGTTTKGEQVDMSFRATMCYRKVGDKWLVVHEHASVPFDPQTNKALLDLKS